MEIINESPLKYVMSADEFIATWKGELIDEPEFRVFYKQAPILQSGRDNTETKGEDTQWVVFQNVSVNGNVVIDSLEEYMPISLSGCTFHDHFVIRNGIFKNLLIGRYPSAGSNRFKGFRIEGGTFQNATELSSISSNEVLILKAMFETKLRVKHSMIKKLYVRSGTFSDGIAISGAFKNVRIDGGIYSSDIELESIFCLNNLEIIGQVFDTSVDEYGLTYYNLPKKKILFDNCGISVKDSLYIVDRLLISFCSALYIKFEDNSTSACYINDFTLLNFDNSLFIERRHSADFQVNTFRFESCVLMKDKIFRFDNLEVNSLEFVNCLFMGSLSLRNIIGQKRKISKFDKNSEEIPFNVYNSFAIRQRISEDEIGSQTPQLTISSSDLGNAILLGCDFSYFKFNFQKSKILGVFLAGTEMPKNITACSEDERMSLHLSYSQIKKIYELRGDHLKANKFYGKEMDAYLDSLAFRNVGRADRWILRLNSLSSNHGQNYEYALRLILWYGIFSYSLLCMSLGIYPSLDIADIGNFFSVAGYFLTFVNPVHKSQFIEILGAEWTPLSEFIDGISRMVFSYLIYQFIQAFRKYGRYAKF